MSINLFFVIILSLLLGMFAYFKPSNGSTNLQTEVPQFELDSFVIYEISATGIKDFFEGDHGKRFSDRYEVSSAKFSNNSKELFESIRADHARYKDDVLTLDGNVHYEREDGLNFRSQEGRYDKHSSLLTTRGEFHIIQNANTIDGTQLLFNTEAKTVSANKVVGSYQLD